MLPSGRPGPRTCSALPGRCGAVPAGRPPLVDREPVGRSRMARSHKRGWRPPFAARRLEWSPVISLPHEERAGWTVVEVTCRRQVPFRIRRVYYVHSVAAGAERGGHAHRKLEELLVAVTGSFDLVLHDGRRSTTIHLDRPAVGVYIPRYSWRELKNFSPGAVCLVLASLPYEESDYVRDFEEFVRETLDSRPRGSTEFAASEDLVPRSQ